MARNHKKMSFYEVISRSRHKSSYGKTLGRLHPEQSDVDTSKTPKSNMQIPGGPAQWPRKPKIVQFNAGRIEISIPYQLAFAFLLGVVLLVLVVYRLGQNAYLSKQNITGSAGKMAEKGRKVVGSREASTGQTLDTDKGASRKTAETKLAASKGDHRIVIQTYRLKAHLEPVKQYFAQSGIETEIIQVGDQWLLVTKEKYENPQKPGTDGYLAKNRVIELGAKYKAPPGYETFAPNFFSDAYGMKVED